MCNSFKQTDIHKKIQGGNRAGSKELNDQLKRINVFSIYKPSKILKDEQTR